MTFDYATQKNAVRANGRTGTAKWSGVAGYANYQINDQWRASSRLEYFDDADGYRTGVAQKWKEATLTLGYLPIKAFEVRAEVRKDSSNVASFVRRSGSGTSRSQRSFGLQGIYSF